MNVSANKVWVVAHISSKFSILAGSRRRRPAAAKRWPLRMAEFYGQICAEPLINTRTYQTAEQCTPDEWVIKWKRIPIIIAENAHAQMRIWYLRKMHEKTHVCHQNSWRKIRQINQLWINTQCAVCVCVHAYLLTISRDRVVCVARAGTRMTAPEQKKSEQQEKSVMNFKTYFRYMHFINYSFRFVFDLSPRCVCAHVCCIFQPIYLWICR